MSAREANRNFSNLLSEVEGGETVVITKNGRTGAELRPRADDPRDDPVRREKFDRMMDLMRAWPDSGYRVGEIRQEDNYGDVRRAA